MEWIVSKVNCWYKPGHWISPGLSCPGAIHDPLAIPYMSTRLSYRDSVISTKAKNAVAEDLRHLAVAVETNIYRRYLFLNQSFFTIDFCASEMSQLMRSV